MKYTFIIIILLDKLHLLQIQDILKKFSEFIQSPLCIYYKLETIY